VRGAGLQVLRLTTCLYSAASMLLRSATAAPHT
jgi:hypothetical protein